MKTIASVASLILAATAVLQVYAAPLDHETELIERQNDARDEDAARDAMYSDIERRQNIPGVSVSM